MKRRYSIYQREAEGLTEQTIDHTRRAIAAFEAFTSGRDFKRFRRSDAVAFKNDLLAKGGRKCIRYARATVLTKLRQVQGFLRWLADQPGYKSRITYEDINYLNLSQRDQRLVQDREVRAAPSLEQVQKVIRTMPAGSDVELRDQALVALMLLAGPRIAATAR